MNRAQELISELSEEWTEVKPEPIDIEVKAKGIMDAEQFRLSECDLYNKAYEVFSGLFDQVHGYMIELNKGKPEDPDKPKEEEEDCPECGEVEWK